MSGPWSWTDLIHLFGEERSNRSVVVYMDGIDLDHWRHSPEVELVAGQRWILHIQCPSRSGDSMGTGRLDFTHE